MKNKSIFEVLYYMFKDQIIHNYKHDKYQYICSVYDTALSEHRSIARVSSFQNWIFM